jgi:hypothetical protein
MPVIPATQEAEIRRIAVRSSNSSGDCILKNNLHKEELEECRL